MIAAILFCLLKFRDASVFGRASVPSLFQFLKNYWVLSLNIHRDDLKMLLLRPKGGEEKRITLSSLQCKFPPLSQLPIAVQQATIKLSALKQEQYFSQFGRSIKLSWAVLLFHVVQVEVAYVVLFNQEICCNWARKSEKVSHMFGNLVLPVAWMPQVFSTSPFTPGRQLGLPSSMAACF